MNPVTDRLNWEEAPLKAGLVAAGGAAGTVVSTGLVTGETAGGATGTVVWTELVTGETAGGD